MKKVLLYLIFHLSVFLGAGQGLIIDHSSTNFEEIPLAFIDDIQDNIKWHYAHTSHGSQLLCGLEQIENSNPIYEVEFSEGYPAYLPNVPGALCIYNGNCGYPIEQTTYWKPEESGHCTEITLNSNPTLNVSAWAWCTELDSYTQVQVQEYLDAMTAYELQFPNVTFIYFTGNAQANEASGYNRHLRCDQIREYCIANNKVLFDFEDLDCWYNGEHSTYLYNGEEIPIQHSAYGTTIDCGHVNYLSTIQKGKAVWMLMAKLRGYTGNLNNENNILNVQMGCNLYPNPANNSISVEIDNTEEELVSFTIIDLNGEIIIRQEGQGIGPKLVKMIDIKELKKGLYIINIQSGQRILFDKFVKL